MACVKDFEDYAYKYLPKSALDYYISGSNDEQTVNDNIKAFKRYKIRPRILRDVSNIDTSTTILGYKISFPVCIAPTAMHGLAHDEREIGTCKGAFRAGTAYTLSTIANSSIEEIAESNPNALKFYQLYIFKKDKSVTEELVRRAEEAGYKALFLTVDSPFFGKRIADEKNNFKTPAHLKMANFESLKGYSRDGVSKNSGSGSGLGEYSRRLFSSSVTWQDVIWLKNFTKLPLVLKGILTAEEARKAVEIGVSAIVVSNHGGRQLDGVPASIDALREVVKAVQGSNVEVYLDGGVRLGTDVFKAIALGAKAVFIGRPALFGLAYDGAAGVEKLLNILKEEFNTSMALAGCRNVRELQTEESLVVHESYYSRL
ncbi:DgyrCDS10355 [Dimorphilus gyrociliatus]|nr:DgyrCDS10355 [Dimorphilus gyrociliatus]